MEMSYLIYLLLFFVCRRLPVPSLCIFAVVSSPPNYHVTVTRRNAIVQINNARTIQEVLKLTRLINRRTSFINKSIVNIMGEKKKKNATRSLTSNSRTILDVFSLLFFTTWKSNQ